MRVLLIHDLTGWSFDNISRNVRAVSALLEPGVHEFRTLSREQWVGNPGNLWQALEWSEFHIFFWRFDLVAALDLLDAHLANKQQLIELLSSRITVTLVYDHLYTDSAQLVEFGDPFGIADIVGVSSNTLKQIYSELPHLPDPDFVLIDGVDTDIFVPTAQDGADFPLRIGWVGNSLWGGNLAPDLKGYNTVFLPAIEQLRAEGIPVDVKVADRATNPVPRSRMPEFYRGLDVYACTSTIEGTPNPVLEAMASGVAIVTTDVGIVREVLGPQQRRMIIDRSPAAFAQALREVAKNREHLARLKAENIANRHNLSWCHRYLHWKKLFARAAAELPIEQRRQDKAEVVGALLNRRRSALSRARTLVFSYPLIYRLYMVALTRQPKLMRVLRDLLRHAPGTRLEARSSAVQLLAEKSLRRPGEPTSRQIRN